MQTKGPNLQNLVVQWKRAHSSSTLTILFSRDLFQTFLAQASSRKSLSLKTELKIHIEQLLLLNMTLLSKSSLVQKNSTVELCCCCWLPFNRNYWKQPHGVTPEHCCLSRKFSYYKWNLESSIKLTVILDFFFILLFSAIYHTSKSLKCFSKYACNKEEGEQREEERKKYCNR